jgi:hypothetical protein
MIDQEIMLLKSMDHPNIPGLVDLFKGIHMGKLHTILVLPYMDSDLAKLMRNPKFSLTLPQVHSRDRPFFALQNFGEASPELLLLQLQQQGGSDGKETAEKSEKSKKPKDTAKSIRNTKFDYSEKKPCGYYTDWLSASNLARPRRKSCHVAKTMRIQASR